MNSHEELLRGVVSLVLPGKTWDSNKYWQVVTRDATPAAAGQVRKAAGGVYRGSEYSAFGRFVFEAELHVRSRPF